MPLTIQAQSPETNHSFTLEEAIRYGIQHNPTLEGSRIDEQIVEEQIKEVRGSALPQVSGNGRFTDNYSLAQQLLPAEVFGGEPGTTIPVTFGVRYSVTAGAEVSQTLFNQQLFTAIKSTAALKDLYKLNTLKTTQDLVENIAKLYLQVQVTTVQRNIAQDNYDRINQLVTIAQLQFEDGLIKRTDVTQLEVNRANLQTQLEDINFGIAQQANQLKTLLNLPVSHTLVLTENLIETPAYPVQDSLTLRTNIQFRQLQQQKDLNELERKAAQAEYLPSLSAFFSYGYQGQTNEFKFTGPGYNSFTNGTWGLSLNVPIFDGFQRQHRVQQRRLEGQQLRKQQEQLTNTIRVDYQNALNQLALGQRQVDNQKQNIQLAEELYEATSLSYKEGVAPLTELLDAETSLQESQSNYLSALLQMKVSELDLLKTSGQLATILETEL
ncbi:MAG: TolC family protein [Cyclobacteriaceae bacterium]